MPSQRSGSLAQGRGLLRFDATHGVCKAIGWRILGEKVRAARVDVMEDVMRRGVGGRGIAFNSRIARQNRQDYRWRVYNVCCKRRKA